MKYQLGLTMSNVIELYQACLDNSMSHETYEGESTAYDMILNRLRYHKNSVGNAIESIRELETMDFSYNQKITFGAAVRILMHIETEPEVDMSTMEFGSEYKDGHL